MDEKKDIEQFSKGFCVPRDLVVNGELIQTVLKQTVLKNDETAGFQTGLSAGKRADEILNDLRRALEMEGKLSGQDFAALKPGKSEPRFAGIPAKALVGISGFSEQLFAQQVEMSGGSALLQELGYDVNDKDESEYRSKICGKIRDYLFVNKTKSGHLSVELAHEEFLTKQNFLDCDPNHVTIYHWDIEIAHYGYSVHHRDDIALKDPTKSPFPTLPSPTDEDGKPVVVFPPHALDPDDPRSIWCRGLDHKLFARGKDVKIINVYRKIDDYPLMRIDENDADGMRFYVSTEESCVDIMFKGYPPESQLPPQVEYCLGRCENPPIINSGGR